MLCRYSHSQQVLLSPIRRLPLSEIFLASLAVDYVEGAFPPREDVLVFGQVCRYWRNVSISTSRLWSALNVDLNAQNMDKEMDMAMTWLARSGGAPLSVKLCGTIPTHPITDAILSHAPRLYMLAFYAPLSIIHSFRGLRGRLPCLRYLIIAGNRYVFEPPMLQSWDAFEIAPELSYVKLSRQVSILRPNFPVTQLRELYSAIATRWMNSYRHCKMLRTW
jgi:hypothetical protein